MLSEDQLHAIEAAEQAATPGQWRIHQGKILESAVPNTWAVWSALGSIESTDDAAFIAGARTWVPQLLADVRWFWERHEDLIHQNNQERTRWMAAEGRLLEVEQELKESNQIHDELCSQLEVMKSQLDQARRETRELQVELDHYHEARTAKYMCGE